MLAGALLLPGGCQAPPARPREPAPPAAGPGARPDVEALDARPLYTFSEAELERYLPVAWERAADPGRRAVYLGRRNLGQPYEIFLLGEFPYELLDPDPLYCLDRSDCLTFCEHMYAMALSRDWWTFLRALQRLRYRDGVIGMLTRNHYTVADWDRNNAYLFEDLTAELGGGQAAVPLRQVCRRAQFFARYGLGQDIPDEPIADHYIPTGNLPAVLAELRDGDFVNIIRGDAESQWAGHTGLIARGPDGAVNLLHSAAPAVREQPLLDYLQRDRRALGVKILRLRPGAERIMAATLAGSPQATEVSPAALRAALSDCPLMSTGAPPWYAHDWARAMHLQAYRLTCDSPVDPELQAAVEAIDAATGTALGIPADRRAFGLLDLTDLRLALVRPDAQFYGASVPKIAIVLAYFETHPEAAAALDPQVERELELVIKRSDNELAAKYSQLVGLETIQKLLQSERYRFYDPQHGGGLWCGKHYGIDRPRCGDPLDDHSHAATVRQCLRFYLMLEQGRLASAAACARMKRIFAAPALEFHNDRFVRGLNGRAVTILRKSGLWEDWHLDTARVQHGGRLYLLAGMAHHPAGEEYLARMAAAADDLLCGPQPPAPYPHELIRHERFDDFWAGRFEHARLSADGRGVTLTCPPGAEALYESPVIAAGRPFNEVLLSWNVDTPAGAGFCVELRIGRSADGLWSPYLYVGDWGDTLPPAERLVTCPQGRIDVDYFRSPERFDRAQYRLRAVGHPDCPTELRIRRIAVCLSDLTGIPPSVAPPEDPAAPAPPAAWQRRLPVPFRSQATDNPDHAGRICNPASVAMVLAYRGRDLPTAAVAAACHDPAHDIYGNWPRSIQAAYSLGLPGYATRLSDWAAVERLIAADQPLVITIRVNAPGDLAGAPYRTTDGHVLVLTGFDADGNVAVNDPAARTAERGCLTYRRADLERVWMRERGGVAYVLEPAP